MKTAKQLQDIFIKGRYGNGTPFYHYALDLIYKGQTVKDRLCMFYKIDFAKIQNGTEEEVKKIGLDFSELKTFISKEGKEADRRINSRFEKYRIELNEFLRNN